MNGTAGRSSLPILPVSSVFSRMIRNVERFTTILKHKYPYGDTSYDTNNVSFYVRGQFGDAIFDLTRAAVGKDGDLRVIDFLSGKMFILPSGELD